MNASNDYSRVPFSLNLACGTLEATQMLRLLPGRRVVCRATCADTEVVAKLFIHPNPAKRQRDYRRELDGHTRLRNAAITTPELLGHANCDDVNYILYRYIPASTNLGSIIKTQPDDASLRWCQRAVAVVALMHANALRQIDLHVDNFLVADGQLYTIDCGDIAPLSAVAWLRRRQIITNLADMLSQLPLAYDRHLDSLLSSYAAANPQRWQPSAAAVRARMWRWRRWRMRNYVKKAARTCSEFVARRRHDELRVCRRDHSDSAWQHLYDTIDAAVEQGQRLKDGNSATVARCSCAGEEIIIKRYNIKNRRHALSRALRPSRAWHSWCSAQRLNVLGIATPQPIAVIEKRRGPLRHTAYYISRYDGAADLLCRYNRPDAEVSPRHLYLITQLFTALRATRISHGDLKANNLLIDNDHLAIIDLDAMRFHRWECTFRRAQRRDMERFMRNWTGNSAIAKQFAAITRDI